VTEALVELTGGGAVLARNGRELIRLDTQRIHLPPSLVGEARQEILARDGADADGFRLGFLLGVEEDREAPVARRVVGHLQRELVDPVGGCRGAQFSLSFLNAGQGPPPEATEGPMFPGFHLDTHPDVTDDEGAELLRVLVNLAPTPRALRFVRADRFELQDGGLDLPRSSYSVGERPAGFDEAIVEIPPFDGGAISYLTFWASLVPHVGVDRPEGHFLASFEAVANRPHGS
jgi:hypothetical protein